MTWPANSLFDAYAVNRVLLSNLDHGEYGVCVASPILDPAYTDAEIPPQGDGFAYIVRGVDWVCGLGSLGADSAGVLRVDPAANVCP